MQSELRANIAGFSELRSFKSAARGALTQGCPVSSVSAEAGCCHPGNRQSRHQIRFRAWPRPTGCHDRFGDPSVPGRRVSRTVLGDTGDGDLAALRRRRARQARPRNCPMFWAFHSSSGWARTRR